MSMGLIGRKCGMTRIFTEAGDSLPVTVIEIVANHVAQLKTKENDGYRAVQIAVGKKKASKITKPMVGHFAKAGIEGALLLQEFSLEDDELPEVKVGEEFGADFFSSEQYVDVIGISKGKGFAGTVKRHNFHMQDATHGNSLSHRAPGSIGQCQTPGRVLKGKKMAGQMGNVRRTVQSQRIVKIDLDRKLLMIKGGVPGAPGGMVVIKPSIKKGDA